MADLLQAAERYCLAGLAIIRTDLKTKRPNVGKWKAFMKTRPGEKQVTAWFQNPPAGSAVSIITGAVSGGVELIDFDCQGEAWKPWARSVRAANADLFARLVVERSQSGGYHVVYRCAEIQIPGSMKLAQKRICVSGDGEHEYAGKKFKAISKGTEWIIRPDLIETRGEGGQFLCSPSAGYELCQGDLAALPAVTKAERKLLLDAARTFDEKKTERTQGTQGKPAPSGEEGLTPWADFDARGDVWEILERHGWQKAGRGGQGTGGDRTEWICRPGKDPRDGHSGSIIGGKLVKVWTSNAAPLEPEKTYRPSEVFCLLEAGGDWTRAAKEMRAQGYGDPPKKPPKVSGKPKSGGNGKGSPGDLPEIVINERQLVNIRADCWAAIRARNDPPRLFDAPGGIARVAENSDTGEQSISLLSQTGIRHEIASMARWVEMRYSKTAGDYPVDAIPPAAICADLLEQVKPPLPYLKRIAQSPIFSADGRLHQNEGYNQDSRAILRLGDLKVKAVPPKPSGGDVRRAVEWIDDMLCDIPFVGPSERAHAIGVMILPFVRDMISGPTPLHSIEASTPGTGKTLLVELLTTPAMSRRIPALTEGRDDEEWRKRITSKLMTGSPYILIDNVKRKLDSGQLAAAVGGVEWEDRLLGGNKMIRVPIVSGWLLTGNNVQMSSELVRRTVRIRLDARSDRPWERPRETFRHPRVVQWAREHRADLIWAVLTVCQRWLSEGRPEASVNPLGTFEDWSSVIGSILHCAGIPGFLENLSEFYEQADAEGEILRAFVAVWWEEFGSMAVRAAELRQMIDKRGVPLDLGKVSEHAQAIRLGKRLTSMDQRHFTLEAEGGRVEYRVEKMGSKQGVSTFRLQQMGAREEIEI